MNIVTIALTDDEEKKAHEYLEVSKISYDVIGLGVLDHTNDKNKLAFFFNNNNDVINFNNLF